MDESIIENTLSKLSNDSSKLLYLISYIFGKGKINKQQKIKLKELVCQEKELVFNLLINYKNITNFIDSAKLVVMNSEITKDQTKSTVHKALISVLSQNQIKQNEFDDLPSPDLRRRTRTRNSRPPAQKASTSDRRHRKPDSPHR